LDFDMSTIQLRVNHGRWIADCPKCRSALTIQNLGGPQLYERFACYDCGYGLSDMFKQILSTVPPRDRLRLFENEGPFFQIAIIYPDERDEIESILLTREMAENQNWQAGETLEDLRRENETHGVIT
jgi:Zn ribbon nucleic-acid-binding protein